MNEEEPNERQVNGGYCHKRPSIVNTKETALKGKDKTLQTLFWILDGEYQHGGEIWAPPCTAQGRPLLDGSFQADKTPRCHAETQTGKM